MKFTFALFHYFPYGGMQRSFRLIAEECVRRGHQVEVITTDWQGAVPEGFDVRLCPVSGISNHRKIRAFYRVIQQRRQENKIACLIGCNKMPALDFYYGADSSIKLSFDQKYGAWFRLSSRYRTYVAYERAVFAELDGPTLLMISEQQKAEYQQLYKTAEDRFIVLPPGLAGDRVRPQQPEKIKQHLREAHSASADDTILLLVASAYKTKGLDRAIKSLRSLRELGGRDAYLWVVGEDNTNSYQQQAKALGVEKQLIFLGAKDNVLEYMAAADLLIHPARKEAAGNVLLEALLMGLPVLTTDVCGYACHVESAKAGKVTVSPFSQLHFNELLSTMLENNHLQNMSENALNYSAQQDFYSRARVAVDCLEKFYL